MAEEKHCYKCHKFLPLMAFHKHPKMADGHLNKCRDCTRIDRKKISDRLAGTPIVGRTTITHKKCPSCLRDLPLEHFYYCPTAADGHESWCAECKQAQSRTYRNDHPDLYQQYYKANNGKPERKIKYATYRRNWGIVGTKKYNARRAAHSALKSGLLHREPCYFCGSTRDMEMHHPDYSRPLMVYWLCRKCHRRLDGMMRTSRVASEIQEVDKITSRLSLVISGRQAI
jgi:hypothetical protein